MGEVEAEFRGGSDVILEAAIKGCSAEDWPKVNAKMKELGLFKSDYASATDALLDLGNLDADLKEEVAEQIKEGEFEL